MKQKVLTGSLCILMGLTLASCGKEVKENKHPTPDNILDGTKTNLLDEKFNQLVVAVKANDDETVKTILSRREPIDLNQVLSEGETLLTFAISKNSSRIVELLLEYNASLFKTNTRKETPLMVASKLGYENLVRLLISMGAKPDYKDENGNTALHHAIINKFENVAIYLINNGANIDITNNADQTALKLAESNELTRVISLLRSLTQSIVGLPEKMTVRTLITLGDIENLNQLLTRYPTIVHEYKDLNFFVLILNCHDHDKALRMSLLLLGYGADLNGATNADVTPLIESVKKEYEDFVNLMLKERVNPNLLDSEGKSALVWAIMKNSQPMVKALIDSKAAERYSYTLNGKKKTMKACDVAREVKKSLKEPEDKKANEDIMDLLGCGLRWLF